MKLALTVFGITVCSLLPAAAAPGTQHFGPFLVNTTDGGSCPNSLWADDTFERRYTVISNGGGNFTVREQDHGTFVTIAGASPGACETTPHHGATVAAGIQGDIQGSADFTVNSATYNPSGCDANPLVCSTRHGFVTAVFGVGTGFTFTAYNFEYSSSDRSLAYDHWQDKSTDHALGNDKFEGDIANQ